MRAPHKVAPAPPGSITASLLAKVQARDEESWRRLVDLYGPLVYHWCRSPGLQNEDRADIFQEVFHTLAQKIDVFCRDRPGGTFRGWLRTITRNKLADHFRKKQEQAAGGSDALHSLQQIAAPAEVDDPLAEAAQEHALLHRALDQVRREFEPATWRAFWLVVVEGRPGVEVAGELGISANAVYKARARVLQRLQEHLGDRIGID